MKILVVDDALLGQVMFKRFLSKLGYTVSTCGDGEKALEAFKEEDFPLVITDLIMPVMDGYELCRNLRALLQGKQTVILAITAQQDPGILQKVLDAGADDYLDKPDLLDPSDIRIFQIRIEIASNIAQERAARKRAQEALRQSQERLELALIGADLGLWDWHIMTGELVVNARWADMLDYQLEDIAPHINSWKSLIHPDDRHSSDKVLNTVLEDKIHFYEVEFRLKSKTGHWKWVLCRGKVVERDEDGTPLRMAGTNLDITERKMSEAEIKILRGYLPICSSCKKIRDDEGYWQQVEDYIGSHSEAEFTHSLCQDCAKKLYPELYKD